MSDELIQQKIALCEESLAALEKIFPQDFEALFPDPLTLPAIERYFQLVVDSAVDCNNLILETKEREKPETYFGTFTALGESGVISSDLAAQIAPSVGLRNALIHRYEGIDRKRMHSSIGKFIQLYRQYLRAISKLYL
ncbi:MAG: hypothetical protein UY70_C0008G0006 [Candidatus Kaiserbacteria bacterium GW2011_GWB1_52_6]|uniref:DUF86 domain-containing protein n=2 Tax=Candidatus Kaiseribacteriota TaxID=1752734 RepID=A0A0G1ZID5_9BACT|nr:MAG: hypothetical protein UY67_C0031G0006 [Candidatus Kaiserbacteria bacterium GW2011_GWA2_52_12]KKW27727.1 MAG: hypothetical protein UY70_C0008G0006 [Candidatus Kaiserbacteria bacterium GW2011_GWB1_52_6]